MCFFKFIRKNLELELTKRFSEKVKKRNRKEGKRNNALNMMVMIWKKEE